MRPRHEMSAEIWMAGVRMGAMPVSCSRVSHARVTNGSSSIGAPLDSSGVHQVLQVGERFTQPQKQMHAGQHATKHDRKNLRRRLRFDAGIGDFVELLFM